MSKNVPLTQGHNAIVDDDVYDYISSFKWQLHNSRHNKYARRHSNKKDSWYTDRKTRSVVCMHRFVYELKTGKELTKNQYIDHIDNNGLNNTFKNLRIVTTSQNNRNCRRPPGKTGFRGVRKFNNSSYQAYIRINNKFVHLGMFSTSIDAALSYDKKYRELEGNELKCNFKEPISWQVIIV